MALGNFSDFVFWFIVVSVVWWLFEKIADFLGLQKKKKGP